MPEEYTPPKTGFDTGPAIEFNRKPGIAVVQGEPYAEEMRKFEQFPSVYGPIPGNPYVKREFPKMLYRAQDWNGKVACMAAPPNPVDYADPREYERQAEKAMQFTKACQRIVQDEDELQRAFEDNWRYSPEEACEVGEARQRDVANEAAARNYEDRNMSPAALAEKRQAIQEAGVHVPEGKPEAPRKRRGRPPGSKNKPKN